MAWSISMTQEGWWNVRANVEHMAENDRDPLVEAMVDTWSYNHAQTAGTEFMLTIRAPKGVKAKTTPGGKWVEWKVVRAIPLSREAHDRVMEAKREHFRSLPSNVLADVVMRQIEALNTCENGGYEVWVDPLGFTTIPVDLLPGVELEVA